jgi:hypothetical protein
MRRIVAVALPLSVAVVVGVLASSALGSGSASTTHTVQLTGRQDVKPTGAPNGKGTFKYQILSSKHQICYSLTWSGIDTPFADHIHKGARATNGNVVVPLLYPNGKVAHSGCVTVPKTLLSSIASQPSEYYINVHTKKYLGGAIRGQL